MILQWASAKTVWRLFIYMKHCNSFLKKINCFPCTFVVKYSDFTKVNWLLINHNADAILKPWSGSSFLFFFFWGGGGAGKYCKIFLQHQKAREKSRIMHCFSTGKPWSQLFKTNGRNLLHWPNFPHPSPLKNQIVRLLTRFSAHNTRAWCRGGVGFNIENQMRNWLNYSDRK